MDEMEFYNINVLVWKHYNSIEVLTQLKDTEEPTYFIQWYQRIFSDIFIS